MHQPRFNKACVPSPCLLELCYSFVAERFAHVASTAFSGGSHVPVALKRRMPRRPKIACDVVHAEEAREHDEGKRLSFRLSTDRRPHQAACRLARRGARAHPSAHQRG